MGCATQVAVKKMTLETSRMALQVAALDSLVRAQEAEAEQRWIGLSTDGDDIKQRVQQVQARLDEVSRRLADLARDIEAIRLSSGGKGRPGAGRPAAAAPPADAERGTQPLLISDARELYDLAFADMSVKNYALAIAEFSQLLDHFPQSEQADNACYWLGECYYAQGDYPKAVEAFERLLKEYPQGDKAPDALLKLGYAFAELKEKPKALQYLREVADKYPDTEPAKKARERLKTLEPASKPGKRR
jgi:tol-pal system protein YbgF